MQKFLSFLAWGLSGLTVFSLLAPYLHPLYFWPLSILGLFLPIFTGLNLVLFLLLSLRRQRTWYLPLLMLLLSLPILIKIFGWKNDTDTAAPKNPLSVVTLNTQSFQWDQKNGESQRDLSGLIAADVLFFQEFPVLQEESTALRTFFKEQLGLPHLEHDPKRGLLIASRQPIRKVSSRYFDNRFNGYLVCDLELPDKKIRLINLHLQSNSIGSLARNVGRKGDLREKKTWSDLLKIFRRHRRSSILRADQAKAVRRLIRTSPHPVLLCGDLNEPPHSYVYRQLADGLQDAFLQKGSGWGATYPDSMPLFRIDYILADPRLQVGGFDRIKVPFSDHRAVRAVLKPD